MIRESEDNTIYIHEGDLYYQSEFCHLINLIKKCGDRLKEIANKRRKEKLTWHGKIVVEI